MLARARFLLYLRTRYARVLASRISLQILVIVAFISCFLASPLNNSIAY